MQIRSLAVVLLRVVAVFVMSQGFVYLAQFVSFASQDQSGNLALGLSLSLFMPLAIGLVIWIISPSVASLAVKQLPPSIELGEITDEGLVHAAFVVAGVWLFINAFPSLVVVLFRLFEPGGAGNISAAVARALECGFGIALVAGSRTMAGALLRLRYAGTSP